jgi:prepilin-type N-terminal cleavage/methylation domain-containing protein/prepilin-type processing-associated H-X9-DG protein
MKKSLRSAFTLIELLVVIAIIAILAAILFPVFAQAREKARTASCASNCKQLALAFQQYKQDYDERYPFGGWLPNSTGTWEWQNTIAPYVKNRGVYRCPSMTDKDEDPNDPTAWSWDRNPVGYMYNNFLGMDRNPVNDSTVQRPADCVLLGDGHSDWGGRNGVDWMGRPNTVWLMEDTYFGRDARLVTGWGDSTWGMPRHANGGNFAFCDGHVKWYKVMAEGFTTRAQYEQGGLGQNNIGHRQLQGSLPWAKNVAPSTSTWSDWGAADKSWVN